MSDPKTIRSADSPRLWVGIAMAAGLVAACQTRPDYYVAPPPIATHIEHRVGGAIATYEKARNAALDPAEVWAVFVRGFVISPEVDRVEGLIGVGDEARLLIDPEAAQPVRGSVPAFDDVVLGLDAAAVAAEENADNAAEDPRDAIEFVRLRGALPELTTCTARARKGSGASYAVALDRDGDTARVAVERFASNGLAVALAILEVGLEPDGPPLWIALPPQRDGTYVAFSIRLEHGDPDDAAHVAAVLDCGRELEEGMASLAARMAQWTAGEEKATEREAAWRALADERTSRAALVVLTGQRLSFAHDVALGATDAFVNRWAARLAAQPPPAGGLESMAWVVERSAIELVCGSVDFGDASSAQLGMLLRHFGELGRFPTDLMRRAEAVADRAEFDAWLTAENRRLLTSSDPAARVRALDWLTVRGRAPAGFDPFASREERRAALRRADAAATEGASTAGDSPAPAAAHGAQQR